ncbi:hypothetical protein VOLCADRAFT_93138 [Volvox carteri f. nagariensis]|uniref:Uncharacterized protein n=1 Tax=Volvox carteri f. nagariensis TaxID=3068 RepID=D8U1E4_VOLCA|nr:uncharacterized protein VOLCADRAFT_93138 [Volvox carteri f. nagariensis]EFJ46325.1 hypothetical protein VOLCADRAFT_93138 [Volvox carteri f. nagariensis]|eukprot:XP_002952478.1 hypothetical protein VOLCADRAFT_93138 [Volvox carteri f. nagariensis]
MADLVLKWCCFLLSLLACLSAASLETSHLQLPFIVSALDSGASNVEKLRVQLRQAVEVSSYVDLLFTATEFLVHADGASRSYTYFRFPHVMSFFRTVHAYCSVRSLLRGKEV